MVPVVRHVRARVPPPSTEWPTRSAAIRSLLEHRSWKQTDHGELHWQAWHSAAEHGHWSSSSQRISTAVYTWWWWWRRQCGGIRSLLVASVACADRQHIEYPLSLFTSTGASQKLVLLDYGLIASRHHRRAADANKLQSRLANMHANCNKLLPYIYTHTQRSTTALSYPISHRRQSVSVASNVIPRCIVNSCIRQANAQRLL